MSLQEQKAALVEQCDHADALTETIINEAKLSITANNVDGAMQKIQQQLDDCEKQIDAITLQLPRTIARTINKSGSDVTARETLTATLKQRLLKKFVADADAESIAAALAINVRRVLKVRHVMADPDIWVEQETRKKEATIDE